MNTTIINVNWCWNNILKKPKTKNKFFETEETDHESTEF